LGSLIIFIYLSLSSVEIMKVMGFVMVCPIIFSNILEISSQCMPEFNIYEHIYKTAPLALAGVMKASNHDDYT